MTLKIGTVGTNFIVSAFIDAARMTGQADVTAVYSRDTQTAAAFAEKHSVQKQYTDKAAFLSDTELDFIYVAAPNSLHYKWTRDALLEGRNVICEKPFVSTERELRELIDLAREKKLFLFEALTIPHLPNYRLIGEQLSEIGPIRLVQLNFSQYSSRYDMYLRGELPNAFNPEFSGGALMDLNYYNLNFVLGLFGEPESTRYFPNIAENGIDTSGVLVMQYPGFVCTAVACKDSKSQNLIQIQGEGGYIVIPTVSSMLADGFTVYTKQGEKSFNAQDKQNVLYYELCDFTEIFEKKDYARCEALLEKSLIAARIVEHARKDAGIFFAADEE